MNIRTDFAVLLRLEADEFTLSRREELLGLLADYSIQAIHEDNAEPGICWNVSFGERAWQILDDPGLDEPIADRWVVDFTTLGPVDVNWQRFPDLAALVTAEAGKAVAARFAASDLRCQLVAEHGAWSPSTFERSHGRVRVGRIIVAPPWHFPDPDDTTIILKIKPSMGFGTGHHPSTRLALFLLQQVDCAGRDVLDIGTGSGVLAMAAARLGAARVCAIDRDPNALAAAAEGLQRNRLTNRVELRHADISKEAVGEYDLVIANLDAVQIQAWADSMMRHLRRPGQLLVSGFLMAEAESISRTLPPRLVEYEGDWAAFVIDWPTV